MDFTSRVRSVMDDDAELLALVLSMVNETGRHAYLTEYRNSPVVARVDDDNKHRWLEAHWTADSLPALTTGMWNGESVDSSWSMGGNAVWASLGYRQCDDDLDVWYDATFQVLCKFMEG